MQGRRGGLMAVMIAVVLGLAAQAARAESATDEQYYELMKTFVDTFEQIERNYVKEVDRRELLEAALRGMLAKLDPYSSYIDPDELTQFNQQVEQEFGGIGIQVTIDPKTRQLTVLSPLPGTPAYKAGIQAGDKIVAIEGQPTAEFGEGKELETAVRLMKGQPGELVKVTVRHAGAEKSEDFEIVRDIIRVSTVQGDYYNPDGTWNFLLDPERKIGYIRLTHFSRNSSDEMEAALKELKSEGMRGLVLDLRFNPGGLLEAACEIADQFIEKGTIVSTKGRNTEEQVVRAKRAGTHTGFPIVVLVNRYSASASEILSACIQDHAHDGELSAIVVGERTWGKGSVQNVIQLEGGKSALKLTTSSYHRPSGKNIHRFPNSKESDEWGVMPDKGYEVKLSVEEMQHYLDYRRDRDVLRKDGPPKSDYTDPQLEKGLSWLKERLEGEAEAKPPSDNAPDATKPANARGAASLPFRLLRLAPREAA